MAMLWNWHDKNIMASLKVNVIFLAYTSSSSLDDYFLYQYWLIWSIFFINRELLLSYFADKNPHPKTAVRR